jgi:hypothetical protein
LETAGRPGAGVRPGRQKNEALTRQVFLRIFLDFGQPCGKMWGPKKYEESIDFSAIVL